MPARPKPLTFATWAKQFRAAAKADDYSQGMNEATDDEAHDLRVARRAVLATIELVARVLAFRRLDRKAGAEKFLRKQVYDTPTTTVRYKVTLIEHDGSHQWVHVDDLAELDFADLLASMPRLAMFTVERADYGKFRRGESRTLERALVDDLRFDYPPSALSMEITRAPSCLTVAVWLA